MEHECVYSKIDDKSITKIIILLHIIFNKIKNIKDKLTKNKSKICIQKNFYILIKIFDLDFYISRLKGLKSFSNLIFNMENINIKISSEVIYEVFNLSNNSIDQQKIILNVLSNDLLYNSHYMYHLIQFIIKKKTFFYDRGFFMLLCNIIIKIFNLNQNNKNIIDIVIYNKQLDLSDIHKENKDSQKKKYLNFIFLKHASVLFLLFIFRNINIYEHFDNVLDTLKLLFYIIMEIKNPYSFLFFVKHTR
ncbi:conserved protein, unknown function [Hepatocystis sp. ex Piliocolobus tephrosceles]|nr:conserved protein, unknown function [Hepatocystis sp. ex Piliocolobus tephrosceles]